MRRIIMYIDMVSSRGWERSAVPGYSEPAMGSSAKARPQLGRALVP